MIRLCLIVMLLQACLEESLDGESIRSAAFSDASVDVTILNYGGMRWTETDIWVTWSGPATLREPVGYSPCSDVEPVAAFFAKRDEERATQLADANQLQCTKKGEGATGRWFLRHSSGLSWWRAWDHS